MKGRAAVAILTATLTLMAWAPADVADATTFVVTTTADDGPGSLRQAISDANATPGQDRVTFAIPGVGVQTISPRSLLPTIVDSIVLDGTSQPGYGGSPLIEIEGSSLPRAPIDSPGVNVGLSVAAGGSTIRALAVNRFESIGIEITTPACSCPAGQNVLDRSYVGTDPTGSLARPNGIGVMVWNDAPATVIGGTANGVGNLLSGNGNTGLRVQTRGNAILGNRIGTNAAGTAALGNGVGIVAFQGNAIGGTEAGAGNLVSGNIGYGMYVTVESRVQGNLIGTDVSGRRAIGNGETGVRVEGGVSGADPALIGGIEPGARNVISGNAGAGVMTSGTTFTILGNLIGLDITGTGPLGNRGNGVVLSGGTLGGSVPGARNVISANDGAGVQVVGQATIQGNYIGADASGNVALGNGSHGVDIADSARRAIVGGAATGAGNVISGNRGSGVRLAGLPPMIFYADTGMILIDRSVTDVMIEGNLVGTGSSADVKVPNASHGVEVGPWSLRVVGAGNTIAFNAGIGVLVAGAADGTPDQIYLRHNSIFANGGLGIDLIGDGVTPNDPGDADSGPNALQNFPVLTAADLGDGTTRVEGTLKTTAGTPLTVEVFASPECDASQFGEGRTSAGTTTITTDSVGNVSFVLMLPLMSVGTQITATATGPHGTSELSACRAVRPAPATACSPRPPIGVAVVRDGPVRLRATVTAGAGPLHAVTFRDPGQRPGGPVNLLTIETPSGPMPLDLTSTYTPPPNTVRVDFTIQRAAANAALHVPLVIVDDCGPWSSFVGIGAGAP